MANDPKRPTTHDVEQNSTLLADMYATTWGRMHNQNLASWFTREESMQLLLCYTYANVYGNAIAPPNNPEKGRE